MSIVIGALAIVLAIIIFTCSCVPSQSRIDTEGVSLLIASALFLIAAAIAFH